MVSSTTKKIFALAISLLVVVISLTGVALGAVAPTVTQLTRYTPGFAGSPGKMSRDAAGNFYVTDFWGKGIVKLDSQGNKIGFIATNGRPSAVAALPDNRLVVAIAAPQPKIAFYKQLGAAPNVSGEEDVANIFTNPTVGLYRPVAITVDSVGKIYVLDSGDNTGDMNGFQVIVTPASIYRGNVKVYSPTGTFLHEFGERTYPIQTSTTAGYFKQPQGIAYEKENHHIVVADTQNGRLQYFTESNGTSCTYVKSVGSTAGLSNPTVGASVLFANPVDVGFEYNDSTVLQRVYVAEKGKNQITVFDPATNFYLAGVQTVGGETMNMPSAIYFERTGAGASTAGVVYTANAANALPANILSFGIDGGTIPAQTVTMTMNTVPATSPSSPITVSGTTTPAADVSCSVNGGTSVPAGNGNWSASLPLVTGNNYILCKSATGNASKSANTYFGTVTPAPVIAITTPTSGAITKNATITVSGTTDMANTTVELVNNSFTATTQSDASNHWSAVINLTEGSNSISATGSKPGTATSSPVSVTVTKDAIAPVLNVAFLNTGSTTNEAVQNIDGSVADANLDTVEVNGVVVPAASLTTTSDGLTYFSVPVTLVRGSNTVTVKATDRAGNSNVTPYERTVTLNPEIPGLTVALPADNSFMAGVSSAAASGSVATSFVSIDAAGQAVTPSAGAWNTTTNFAVSNSLSPYMFKASGGGNPDVTVKRTIANNALYAQLAITNPPADLAVKATPLIIEGVVAPGFSPNPVILVDGAACAVTLDAAYVTNGKFSCTPAAFTEGEHVIKATAGVTTTIRHIILDTVNPDLTIQADSKSMPTTINGTIEPSAKISAITASLNAVPVIIPLSKVSFDPYNQSGTVTWHADLNGYTYDTISFSTTDPAGNVTTLAYEKGIPTGDIDGDGVVRLADALAALRHVAGTEAISDTTKFFNGDVGGLVNGRASRDGIIDVTDSVLILKKAYGLMVF